MFLVHDRYIYNYLVQSCASNPQLLDLFSLLQDWDDPKKRLPGRELYHASRLLHAFWTLRYCLRPVPGSTIPNGISVAHRLAVRGHRCSPNPYQPMLGFTIVLSRSDLPKCLFQAQRCQDSLLRKLSSNVSTLLQRHSAHDRVNRLSEHNVGT